jgi:hypothetical protein
MLADIAETADALTDSYVHVQDYEVWDANRHKKLRKHRTRQPGLLQQLRTLVEVLGQGDGAGRAKAEGSPAPLNLEAASLLMVVTMAAFRWCNRLDLEQRDTVEDNVRALVGAAGATTSDLQRDLLTDMRGWHRRSSILTGWTTPPFRPRAGCPWCARPTLVVNLDARTAFCANEECGAGWREEADLDNGWGSIFDLGEHVRVSNGEDVAA